MLILESSFLSKGIPILFTGRGREGGSGGGGSGEDGERRGEGRRGREKEGGRGSLVMIQSICMSQFQE